MSSTPKTIDNLGIETYSQYEDGKAMFDEEFLKESSTVVSITSRDTHDPLLYTQEELLFDYSGVRSRWCSLHEPSSALGNKDVFSNQIAKKLGPTEVLEAQMARVEEKKQQEVVSLRNQTEAPALQTQRSIEEVTKEAKSLITLMQDIDEKNNMIGAINAERFRYSKG